MPPDVIAFLVLMTASTGWDWYDHVSRTDSAFAEHPVAWGLFTIASIGVLFAIIVVGSLVVRRLRGRAGFLTHAGLLVQAFMAHVYVSGPRLSALLWPHGEPMMFKPIAALMLAGGLVAVLGVLRLVFPPARPTAAVATS